MLFKNSNKLLKYNGKLLQTDPYNPLNLPPYTLRLKYKDNFIPTFSKGTGVQVSTSPNIWDLTYESSSWAALLYQNDFSYDLLEVLGANSKNVENMYGLLYRNYALSAVATFDTSNVTSMGQMFMSCPRLSSVPNFNTSNVKNIDYMFDICQDLTSVPLYDTSNVESMIRCFYGCESLTSVPHFNTSKVTRMKDTFAFCTSLSSIPLFDTSNVTNLDSFCEGCYNLKYIPLFDTSKVRTMNKSFYHCYNVESGALALYQQASTQATPPTGHSYAFEKCGISSTNGSAELAQIAGTWK